MAIFDPKEIQEEVSVVGVGNIGSQTSLALARLGIEVFRFYDFDHVEPHNLSSQSFFLSDHNRSKVEAIMEQVKNVNPEAVPMGFQRRFSGSEFEGGILVIAVDSMEERRKICSELKEHKLVPRLIIDGRMGGPQLEIYTCTSLDEWETTFVDNPSQDPCGARYICYISMVIGAWIANQVKRFLKQESYKKQIIFNIDTLQLIACD